MSDKVIEVVEGEVIEGEVLEAELVEGEILGEVVEEDIIDGPNLDFNINEEEITSANMSYGYTLNDAYRNRNSISNNYNQYEYDINSDLNKSKFKTIAYINKKTLLALNREASSLKKEILEAYELAVKSSSTEYVEAYSRISTGSEIDTVIGNTIYQYKIHNLGIDEIVNNVSIRLTFHMFNKQTQSIIHSSSGFSHTLKEYKYHVNILVPIILDKVTGSWYEIELNQLDTTLGLLTPVLFNSFDHNNMIDFYTKECSNSFDSVFNSKKLDKEVEDVISRCFSEFCNNQQNSYFDSINNKNSVIEFLESLGTEEMVDGHNTIVYPVLASIALKKEINFEVFCKNNGFNRDMSDEFTVQIKSLIAKELTADQRLINLQYGSSKQKVYSSQGSNYKDLRIPDLFRSWRSVYKLPFNDYSVISIFINAYIELCNKNGIDCSIEKGADLYDVISGKIRGDSYYTIMDFLNSAIYSRQYPVTTLAEYVNYVEVMHNKLGIPSPVSKTNSDSIFEGIGYLSQKVNIIENVMSDSISEKFIIECDCGIVSGEGDMEVSDYLTQLRIEPNMSGIQYVFDMESTMSENIKFVSLNSNNFEDIGRPVSPASVVIGQSISVCPECGKIHMFSEGEYRALDICAQKFLSERNNSTMSKFVQRCTLSKDCVEEFANEFYRYFESKYTGDLTELPLNLPNITEDVKEDIEVKEEVFSEFDFLATEFISMLEINKDQYSYENAVSELNVFEEYSRVESAPNAVEIISDLENIGKGINNKSETEILRDGKRRMDNKYYNNFIWYFLSNNLTSEMSAEEILKLKISEVLGRKNIDLIIKKYNTLKNIVKSIGKLEFYDIRDLNNLGSFPTVDIVGNAVNDDTQIESLSSDDDIKLCYKYINLAKRCLKNSETHEEFDIALKKCNIGGESLSDYVIKVLNDEYNSEQNFEYSNEKLVDSLRPDNEGLSKRYELYDLLESTRNEIDKILESVEFSRKDNLFRDYYVDFDLSSMCIIIGCYFKRKNLNNCDLDRYFNKIIEVGDKITNRLCDKFSEFDDGALYYLNYLLGSVDFDFEYNKIINGDLISNFLSNYCIICREFIKPSRVKIDGVSLDKELREYCLCEISNNASCKFYKKIVSDVYDFGVCKVIDIIDSDFESFAFRIMEQYPVDLYNPRLVNSILGKGLSKVSSLIEDVKSKEASEKAIKKFPNKGKVFPRINPEQRLFGAINKEYEKNLHRYKFKIVDNNGSVVSNNVILDKIRSDILAFFKLMDIDFCISKDEAYEKDIFKVFNLTFNLPSSFISKGLADSVSKLNVSELDISYDYLSEFVDDICENQYVIDSARGEKVISFTLEKSQMIELTTLSKLCINCSIIPYRAEISLINSELSGMVN